MNVKNLLEKKGNAVFSINEDQNVSNCITMLNEKHIGILVVTDKKGAFKGLVSERDVLRVVAGRNQDFTKLLVKQIMTPREKLFTVQKDEHLDRVMTMMTEKRVRHIPIMDGDLVLGIVSIGDVIKNLLENAMFENEQLKKYITGGL